jgi:RNA polymerase sigma-70 factor, ECF subfamily
MDRSAERVLDELLVLAAQSGDEKAFSDLVNRWHRSLLRHAIQLTERSDAAADVMQEAWLAIARGIAGLEDPACFPRWAFQIVSRKSADWVRGRRREHRLLEHLTQNPVDTSGPRENSANDRAGHMQEALRRLPSDRRALFSMIYLDNLSIAQAAEALGIPAGTIKSRLHHTRQELRDLLKRSES